ncbi:MAG: hypothetical protein K2Z81_06110 [Cyanobacteria bacterium]|nr:hypothetical protein [Cyanobacteriota bacterium]
MKRKRGAKGVSLVETMAGFMVLIPIGLAAIDIAVLVATSQTNEEWAESAARIAGRQRDESKATKAAESTIEEFETSNTILSIQVVDVQFDLKAAKVTVTTDMEVRVPIPIPFLPPTVHFRAMAIQPIVSIPAPS